jgi:hypothetical protein
MKTAVDHVPGIVGCRFVRISTEMKSKVVMTFLSRNPIVLMNTEVTNPTRFGTVSTVMLKQLFQISENFSRNSNTKCCKQLFALKSCQQRFSGLNCFHSEQIISPEKAI